MSGGGAIPAIAIAAKRRRLIESFRRAGAVSVETARTLDEVGAAESSMLRRLQSTGIVVPAGDGRRFYLDEQAAKADDRRIMYTVVAVVAILVILIGYLLVFRR